MLRGRESLARLVGKRKRNLSPHLNQLLNSQSPSAAADGKTNEEGTEKESADYPGSIVKSAVNDQAYQSESILCPVCGRSIPGDDYSVNSHLDTCLARGSKRKLTQPTLFQLSFQRRSTSNSLLDHSNNLERYGERAFKGEANTISMLNTYRATTCSGEHEYAASSSSRSLGISLHNESTVQNLASQGVAKCDVVNQNIINVDEHRAGEGESSLRLTTVIVGSKFQRHVELQDGSLISILREPENTKDRHAIKVLSTDSGETIGYLPRQLAKFLSVLIDMHQITCKGLVTSLPRNSGVVPIQIFCEKTKSDCEMGSEDHQDFGSLWNSCIGATDDAKAYPPNKPKYQQNFSLLIEEVLRHDSHVFACNEKSFLESFHSLSDEAQMLFIRLYMRKGPWFRMSAILYPEILNKQKAVEELQSAGYIYSFSSPESLLGHDLKEILEVLTVLEMREFFKSELSKDGSRYAQRQELVKCLISSFEKGKCSHLPNIILERAGQCVKISSNAETLLWRVQRLFFLNGEQDLSAFLLVDLGLIKFPDYTCIISRPIFETRADLLAYEEAIEMAQLLDQSLEENNIGSVIRCIEISESSMISYLENENRSPVASDLPTFFSSFSASFVYSKVVSLGASVYERERRYGDAVRLLKVLLSSFPCDSRRGVWMLRLSVDLEHMGYLDRSLSVAEEGVEDPWVRAGSKMALQRRIIRLGKPPRRWKVPSFAESVKRRIKLVNIVGRPLNCETGTKSMFYGYDGELCGVEQLALQYYAGEGGWQGVHSESGIWMTIFALLMWDILFSDVPDVFRSRFQTAPLDLSTDNFFTARKSRIESQLEKINEGNGEQILITSWELHKGTACRGVNWDKHSLSDLRSAVACIGGRCLASLCRHLALDYHNWSSGMPDLFLWRFIEKDGYRGEAKLVEVKGPRDHLSEQQRAWLLLLMDCGFDVEVCKVNQVLKSK